MTPAAIVAAAVQLVEAEGADALGISRVARELGIKPASMYNHLASGEALARAVAAEGTRRIFSALQAGMGDGTEPVEHLRQLMRGTRRWMRDNPGLYAVMARVEPDYAEGIPVEDQQLLGLYEQAVHRVGVDPAAGVHALRSIRSAIHGFVLLEASGQFELDEEVQESFDWMVEALVRGVASSAQGG